MEKRLTRSSNDKIIGGVCGGIADYFAIDPTIVRIIYAAFTLFSAFVLGIVFYSALLFIIPER